MKGALPASPINGLEALAALLHALEAIALFRPVPRMQVVLEDGPAPLSVQALVFAVLGDAVVVEKVILEANRNSLILRHGLKGIVGYRLKYLY